MTQTTRSQRRSTLTVLLASAAMAGAAAGCGSPESGTGQDGPAASDVTIPAVEVTRSRQGSVPLRERLTGTVRAGGQVVIYPQVSGPVVEVMAENGDQVGAGDPLVRIRSETSRSQLDQARANLRAAEAQEQQARADLQEMEAQFERTRALAADSLVSTEALETQRSQVEVARANHAQTEAAVQASLATVEEREEALGQAVVRAPIDGRVGQRNVEVGMRVDGQSPLFTIGRLENMRVRVSIPQEMVSSLEPGQRVEIRKESSADSVIEGEISRISPFLQAGSFSAQAEIDVANEAGALLPGMFVTVDVFYGETASSTLVPRSALYEDPATGQRGLFVVTDADVEIETAGTDGRGELTGPVDIEFRPAAIHAESRQMAGVSDLDPGTWIVVVGQNLLSDRPGEGTIQARIRTVEWNRIVSLQRLQRDDLLREFLEKQQRLARAAADSAEAGRQPRSSGSSM